MKSEDIITQQTLNQHMIMNNQIMENINMKRHSQVSDGQDENEGYIKKSNKKTKKTTSLQGRPAKASKEMRQAEDQIKATAWRTAELEENLYLRFGGAKVDFNTTHYSLSRQHIQSLFGEVIKYWDIMVQEWQRLRNLLQDPLGQVFVPISDKYFFDKFKFETEEVGQQSIVIQIDILFLVYCFQVFLRTDIEGFKKISTMFYQVSQKAVPSTKHGMFEIEKSLQYEVVYNLMPEMTEEMKVVYRLLYKVLEDSCANFKDKVVLNIITKEEGRRLQQQQVIIEKHQEILKVEQDKDLISN